MHIFQARSAKWLPQCTVQEREPKRVNYYSETVETLADLELTKGAVHVTDYSNASRTMLFNINTLQWDDEILAEQIFQNVCCRSRNRQVAFTGRQILLNFGGLILTAGAAGDQQSALFGQTCLTQERQRIHMEPDVSFNEHRRKTGIFQEWSGNYDGDGD